MIQIDMEMPKTCGQCLCTMMDLDYNTVRCRLKYDLCFDANSRDYSIRRLDGCPLHEVTDTDTVSRKPETTTEIQKILDYLDNELHPLVSPDNWNVYSELYDMVSELENLPPSPTVTSDPDTVSRQAIRDAIRKLPLISVNGISSVFYKVDVINRVIDDLPPSPSRPKGRWIDRNDNVATCSVCGERWGLYRMLNFCPHCGADMRQQEGGAV